MSIVAEHVRFAYGRHEVLSDVSFTADGGRLLAVLGPNGVGKTTLFRCILGLQRQYRGSILVDGVEARRLPARQLARRIAYIPQAQTQAFAYTALSMVLMGTTHASPTLSMPGKRETDVAMAALERLGIARLADESFARLSGGERQLVLIARALAQRAGILLMDEPTASLDYGNQAHALSIARELADDGYAVVLSTHNPQHALWYADRALALSGGRVAAFGPPRDVLSAPMIESLYHVRVSMLETEAGLFIAPDTGGGRERTARRAAGAEPNAEASRFSPNRNGGTKP